MPSEEQVEKTIEHWEQRLGRKVHPGEAYRAVRNFCAAAELLARWVREEDEAAEDLTLFRGIRFNPNRTGEKAMYPHSQTLAADTISSVRRPSPAAVKGSGRLCGVVLSRFYVRGRCI